MIKSTELCSYCNEEFDYVASDKQKLVTCPHCGKITPQCNMCDRYKCEDCALSRAADVINDPIRSLKNDLFKYLMDRGYVPGRMYLTEDSARRLQENIATFLSTREMGSTYQVKVDYTPAGDLNIFITDNVKKEEDKVTQKYFRGLDVPVEPKREWIWMKDNKRYCSTGIQCMGDLCAGCIYSQWNCEARAAFYDLTFGESKKEQDFEIGDIVEYTVEYKSSMVNREFTVTTPILAVRLEKETNSKLYLVNWYESNQLRYLDLALYKVKLIKKAK